VRIASSIIRAWRANGEEVDSDEERYLTQKLLEDQQGMKEIWLGMESESVERSPTKEQFVSTIDQPGKRKRVSESLTNEDDVATTEEDTPVKKRRRNVTNKRGSSRRSARTARTAK